MKNIVDQNNILYILPNSRGNSFKSFPSSNKFLRALKKVVHYIISTCELLKMTLKDQTTHIQNK